MNIGGNVNRGYINNKTGREVNEQSASLKGVNNSAKANNVSISNMNINDVFRGQVTNVTSTDVTILLEGMNQITAKMGEALMLNIGDDLLFQVRDNDGKQITIKPIVENQDAGMLNTIEKSIDANGFLMSEKNVTIAKELMLAGQPLDRASMLKVMQQTVKFPEADINTLVSMNKMGMPINEANIAQFDRYMSANHQLSSDVSNTINSIADIIGNMSNASVSDMINGSNNIFNIISDGAMDMYAINIEDIIANSDIEQEASTIENAVNLEEIANDIDDFATAKTYMKLSDEQIDNFISKLESAGVEKKNILHILNNSSSEEEVLNKVNALLNNNIDNIDKSKLKEFFSGEEYKNLLSEVVKKQWSIKPEEMKDSKEIKSLYEKILSQSNKLMDSFSKGEDSSLSQNGKSMQENIKFINDLNQMYSYSQIPVKFNEGEANSELFVYANKNKLAKKEGEISVLLHLDMDNLGPTDVHVSLNGKKVHARFYLEDNVAVDIVSDNIEDLADKLSDRGFTLSNEVVKKEKPKTNMVLDEVFDTEDKEQSVKRYTFDIRM